MAGGNPFRKMFQVGSTGGGSDAREVKAGIPGGALDDGLHVADLIHRLGLPVTILALALYRADIHRLPRYAFAMRTSKLSLIVFGVAFFASTALLGQQGTAPSAAGSHSGPDVLPTSSKDELTLLTYSDHKPVVLSAAELRTVSHISVTIHNSHTNADEEYSGVRLSDLLAKLGAPLGSELRGKALANYIVATGSDGYKAVLALGEVDPSFHPGEVLVADTMNGKPLDAHSGPFNLVVTEDKRPARSVRNLITIELKSGP